MNIFDDLEECLKGLLEPFHILSEYLNDAFYGDLRETLDMQRFLIDKDARRKAFEKQRKIRQRYLDNRHNVQYKRFTIVRVIPRNRPYQRRCYTEADKTFPIMK